MLSLVFVVGVLCSLSLFWDPTTSHDVCDLPKDPGPCRGYFPRWYFNKYTQLCEKFIYGGCGGNANRFHTKRQCVAECGCKLPKKSEPCYANFKRYYYNSYKKKCKKFTWGGCEPNANNFKTKRACKKACEQY